MASIGPSTITGIAPAESWSSRAPNSWAPLWNSGVSAVLRYFGPARSMSLRSGCRRPTNPRISPLWMIGKTTRSRKRSMSRPVLAMVATPVIDHFVVGDPMLPEVVDEVGPAGGCLTGLEPGVVGDVLPNRSAR